MIARASGALLVSYFAASAAGVLFLLSPSTTLSRVEAYEATALVWSLFYIVGGLFAATCIIARKFVKNTLPLWYFEVGGISLLVAANIVYGYALVQTAIQFNEINVLSAAIIILAFAASLFGRCIDTLRLAKQLKKYLDGGPRNE